MANVVVNVDNVAALFILTFSAWPIIEMKQLKDAWASSWRTKTNPAAAMKMT